uniref:choice-of-anchor L domain-containing protein n=1 Tax=Flavobacterium soli TaxID=344881 RepID=UPI00047C1E68
MKKITFLLLAVFYSVVGYCQFPDDPENFDEITPFPGGLPTGWIIANNGVGLNQSWRLTNQAPPYVNGTQAMFVSTEEIGQGNTSEDFLITNLVTVQENGQLRFQAHQTVPGNQGTIYEVRYSTNIANQSDISQYQLLQSWTEPEMNSVYDAFEEKVVDLTPTLTVGQQVYIAFVRVHTQTTVGVGGDRWVLDDVNVTVECFMPTELDAINIASQSALLTWEHEGTAINFQYAVVLAEASQPGNDSPLIENTGTGDVNFLEDNLDEDTGYKYYVRAECEEGVFSDWAGPYFFNTIPFGTVCADPIQVTTLPYETDANTGDFGNSIAGPQGTDCGATPAGTNFLAGNDVIYRVVAPTDGIISITLTPGAARSSVFVYDECTDIGTACEAGLANTNSTTRVIDNFPVVAGEDYYVVVSSSLPTQTFPYNLIIQYENCDKPENLGFDQANATLDGGTASWTEVGTATIWEIAVQDAGMPIPSGPGSYMSFIDDDGVAGEVLSTLETAHLYQYWVRSECSPGVYSAWAGPFVFNTAICAPEDQCTYTFRMTDSANNGWNGARMQIRQNGIVLPILPVSTPPNTIGGTYPSGAGPVDVTVTMCDGVPFDVFWLTAGSQPQQCILSVINSFGQTIYTKVAGEGVPGSVVYSGIVNCDVPQCDLAPTAVTTTNITTLGATVTWTAPGTENLPYEIYWVETGGTPPTNPTDDPFPVTGVNGPAAPFFHVIPNGLTADTTYDVYVRVICNSPGNSPWSAVHTFTTLPTCPKPTGQVVTPGSITLNSAELVWVEGGIASEWEVLLLRAEDGVAPDAPGVTPVLADGDLYYPGLTGATTLTPTNLVNATIYHYYVRAVCGGNDPSTWTGPVIFNTITCADEDKCVFRFRLTSTAGNTWNGARMQVRQNGIVVATIGNNMINNVNGVAVSLCNDVPIDVFWSIEGNQPDTIGFDIVSPFTDIIYTMLPGTQTPLTIVYDDNEIGNCVPPTCPKPIDLDVTVGSITQTTVELSWTEQGTAQQWEVYVVPVGSPLPVNYTPLNTDVEGYYLTDINENPYTVEGLDPGTAYIYYVRAICSADDISTWTILAPDTFITKPVNDECSAALPVPVNPTRVCADFVSGNTLGGTLSSEGTTCTGGKDDDIWYTFVATNPIHIITFSNVVGTSTNIDHVLYSGVGCGNLTQMYCSDPLISIASNLVVGDPYTIRVFTREVSPANGTNPKNASFDLCIITPDPITNDECDVAIVAPVNEGLDCIVSTSGSITGATASPQSSTCAGAEDDDVWFEFTATSPTHVIDFQNVVGSLSDDINHSLYMGDECGTLTLEYCEAGNQSIAEDLVVGNIYKIRVWSAASTLQDITFDLCIGSIIPPITVDTELYTNEELVTEILIKSECATVTNIAWSTGTGVNNGIGYFNKDESQFPFEDGIVLISGSALSVPGPNTNIISGGGLGGDADLSAILAAQTPPVTGTLNNATSLEFDFVAIDPNINFEFMFASEEYGTFQCGFSDAFAFILTDVTEGTDPVNLAVIPGSEPPVPVTVYNIRDNQYNAGCPSVNAEYFGSYYANPAGVLGAPVNFNGITVPMVASSAVIPGHTYHIKMVIADINDSAYDSAVFLKGGSFNIGNINLPEDYLIADGTALCLGDDVLLDSELDPTLYSVQWFNGTDLLEGETNPTLVVSETGTYVIEAAYIGTDCITSDSIVVEYFLDADAGTPNDLVLCDASGNGIFDLTSNETIILAPFTPDTHEVVYFLTEEDAQNNVLENAIPVEDLEAFPGTNGQTIYVRVNYLGTSCFQVVSFDLIVQDLTPQFTLLGAQQICPEGSTTITVSPTANNFDPALVTYTWTFNDGPLAETSGSLTINGEAGYGTYTVTVNNSGCTSTQTFEITNANTTWFFNLTAPADLCPEETGTLSVTVNNNPNGFPVTYTYTLADGSEVVSNNSSITIDEPGTYSVMIDIQGCISGPETVTVGESVADWQIAFEGEPYIICPSQAVTLSFTATNFDINNPDATYTWTSPSGAEGQGATFNATEVGTYTLEVDILGCTSSFEVEVEENSTAIEVEFVQGCESNQYHLEVNPANGSFDPLTSTYVWDGQDVTLTDEPNVIILGANGEYSVTVTTQDGCSVTQSITVNNVGCQIQKGISPNNDGDNDSFDLSAFNVREISI